MSVMQLADLILRSVLGLIIGAGVGAVMGFVKFWACGEVVYERVICRTFRPSTWRLDDGLAGVVLGANYWRVPLTPVPWGRS